MNSKMKILMAAALVSLPIAVDAQTENPRGIYKMTTITGKAGEIKAPFDQYKICTDSVTLMVSEMQAGFFRINRNDSKVFNYTGEHPKTDNDKSTLIYDSNEKQFKMKWWSTYRKHAYFPENDWCIEKYESGQYTEMGKVFFDAITGTVDMDKKNPIIGTWRVIAHVDELRDVKTVLPQMFEQDQASTTPDKYYILTPNYLTVVNYIGGNVNKIEYDGKKSYRANNKNFLVKRLSKNRIAIEDSSKKYHTDWFILERVTDGTSPLSRIASQYLKRRNLIGISDYWM